MCLEQVNMAHVQRLLAVVCVLLAVAAGAATSVRGVRKSRVASYEPVKGKFTCLDKSKEIDFSSVNDDFCDCVDGSDEPGTSACPTGEFYCVNEFFEPLLIPSSRVNDGICDCCDASDEFLTKACSNNCREAAKAKAKAEEESNQVFKQGFAARQKSIAAAKASRAEKLAQIEKLEAQLETLEQEIEEAKQEQEKLDATEKHALEQFNANKPKQSEQKLASLEESRTKLRELLEGYKTKLEQLADSAELSIDELRNELRDVRYDIQIKLEQDEATISPAFLESVDEDDAAFPQEEVSSAKTGREKVKSLEAQKSKIDVELVDLDKDVNADYYGAELEFYDLAHKCINYDTPEYTYELCAFKQVLQKSKNGGSTRLGNWSAWRGGPSAHKMAFTDGDKCWNGPHRSVLIDVSCGLEDKILSVTEPAKCEYFMTMTSPSVCTDPSLVSSKVRDEL